MMIRLGFIGTGEMGFPMTKNLINAGYQLNVFDVIKEPLLRLEEMGAEVCDSPKAVAQLSEVIIIMVRTTEQAESVIIGESGVLEGTIPGSIIIIMSTIDPIVTRKLAKLVSKKGVDLVDAPISGARQGAEDGTLTIMVGGKEEAFNRVIPIFKVLGRNIYYLGESGMGEIGKLINNLLVLVNMVAVYEAKALAMKSGVSMNVFDELIKVSTGNSWVFEHWDIVSSWKDNYREGGTLDILYKDINITLTLGENLKVPLYLSSLAKQIGRY